MKLVLAVLAILLGISLLFFAAFYYEIRKWAAMKKSKHKGEQARWRILAIVLDDKGIQWRRWIACLVGFSLLAGVAIGFLLGSTRSNNRSPLKTGAVYYVTMFNGTWSEAYETAIDEGYKLWTIDSNIEYDKMVAYLDSKGFQGCMFYIGAVRQPNEKEYYWCNNKGQIILNNCINNLPYWLSGEPSYRDDSLDIEERFVCFFYSNIENRWVINDIPNDILAALPNYRGRLGYISESP